MVGSKGAVRTRADASGPHHAPSDPPRASVSRPHEYFPGLDGLRAIAVLAVLFFHAGVADAPGGFLGVSLFFTLSGFLITGLLISESAATGRIALRRFWGRRVRRLMPAALVCLALVLAGSRWLVARASIPSLRIDVVAAAANVANWRFVTAHQSYAELFANQPSAVLHFWSLAIEEQFYLIFPCVVALLLSRRRAWALPVGLTVMIAASVVASLLTTSHDAVYYGTHTRAAELLIGGLLACVVQRRNGLAVANPALRRPAVDRRLKQVLAFAGLIAFVVLVVNTRQSDGWLYQGGFAALAVLWCIVIVAARAPGPFRALVSQRPLVALGRRSYGVYLFHWPVFTLLTPSRLGVHGWQARVIQLAIIAAVTEASYRLIERPIRLRTVLVDARRAPAVAFGCVAAVIATALVLPSTAATTAGSQLTMVDAPDEVVHLPAASPDTVETVPEQAGDAAAPLDHPDAVAPVAGSASAREAGAAMSSEAPTTPTTVASSQAVPPSAQVAAPALHVAVIGGYAEVAARLRSIRDSGINLDIADLSAAGCTVIVEAAHSVDSNGCAPSTDGVRAVGAIGLVAAVDVLAIGIGPVEHQAITDAAAGTPEQAAADVFAVAENLRQGVVAEIERLGTRATRVVIVDTFPTSAAGDERAPDLLDAIIDEAVLSTPSLSRVTLADLQLATIDTSLGDASPEDASIEADAAANVTTNAPLKVMVIGDSTSYGVALGLAGSTSSQFDVLWAGKRNCPLARMHSIRWLVGNEFSMADCPSVTSVWPEQIASFHPDVVLVVDGLPEQSLHRYGDGSGDWHEAGDAEFAAVHDADFRELLDLVADVGAVVILAGQPRNAAGSVGWATTPRIEAWNAQLATWDAKWAPVAMWPYGQAIESAEAAAGHSLRADGLHLDKASLSTIVGSILAPALQAQVVDLRTALASSGCLVDGVSGATLDLVKCG